MRVTPKASADMVEGVVAAANGGSLLKVRLRAVPEKGRANASLERLIADELGLARGSVKVTAGAASRLKTVTVSADPALFADRLERLTARTR